jgi:hypothetical protein
MRIITQVVDRAPLYFLILGCFTTLTIWVLQLGAIVDDDGVRDPKAMDDVGEERHRLFGPDAV